MVEQGLSASVDVSGPSAMDKQLVRFNRLTYAIYDLFTIAADFVVLIENANRQSSPSNACTDNFDGLHYSARMLVCSCSSSNRDILCECDAFAVMTSMLICRTCLAR